MEWLSWFPLKALAWALYAQPAFLRRFWARAIGLALRSAGMRAEVIRQNLAFAYPGDSADAVAERRRLFGEAYFHLGQLVVEILLLLGPMPRYVRRYGEVRGAQNWREAKRAGRGVIMLASHVGDWELMAATGAMLADIDILLVTKQLKPAWFHRAIERGRLACGVRGTYEPRTMRDVLAHLKRNGTVGIVIDQYMGPPVGVRVPVFGVPVGTTAALATLARRTGAAVLPAVNFREKSTGKLVVDIRPPVEWEKRDDPNEEIAVNTARYAAIVERDIREHPEQWLWTHRRFKGDLSPLGPGEWQGGRARG